MDQTYPASTFANKFLEKKGLDRGFNLEYVKDANGKAMSHGKPYHMRINLAPDEPTTTHFLSNGGTISMIIKRRYRLVTNF
jgi:hypothetical protein